MTGEVFQYIYHVTFQSKDKKKNWTQVIWSDFRYGVPKSEETKEISIEEANEILLYNLTCAHESNPNKLQRFFGAKPGINIQLLVGSYKVIHSIPVHEFDGIRLETRIGRVDALPDMNDEFAYRA